MVKQFSLAGVGAKRSWGALAAVSALTLAACGTGGAPSSAGAPPAATDFVGASAGVVDSIRWALPTGEPNTIDPPNAVNYSSALVAGQLCEPVLRLKQDYSLAPNLATLTKPDPLTLVLDLRKDVTFWDGKPMTADDVAWSLNYSRDPKALVSSVYAKVASVAVTGEHQVTVKLSTPDNLLPFALASFAGAVQEKAFVEKAGPANGSAGTGVMCTGPVKFGSWASGQDITLTRNDNYWNQAEAAGTKKITFTFTTDTSSLAQALAGGDIDGAYEVPPSIIPNLQGSGTGKVVFGRPSPLTIGMSVVSTQGALNSVGVRKAFFAVIDRKAIADGVFHGSATPLYGMDPQGLWDNGAWPAEAKQVFREAAGRAEQAAGNSGSAAAIAQAKTDAQAAGYAGAPVTIATLAGDATQSQLAQLIQAQAQAAGFKVTIKPLQAIDYANASTDASVRAGMDLFLSSSFSVAPNPLENLQFTVLPGSPYNYTGYADPKAAELVDKAWGTSDQVEAAKSIVQAEETYSDQYLGANLVGIDEVLYLNNRLSGAMASFPYLNNPSVARIGAAKK